MTQQDWPENAIARIEIDLVEWMAAAALLDGTHPWEDKATGFVLLRSRNGRREWFATDNFALTRITGKPDPEEFEILLPPRLVNIAPTLTDSTATELFVIQFEEGGASLQLRGEKGEVFVPWRQRPFPDVDSILDGIDERPVDATIDAVVLATAIRTVQWSPEPIDEDAHPTITFGSQSAGLWLRQAWDDQGQTILGLNGPGTGRDFMSSVNPHFLRAVVERFSGPVAVTFGDDPGDMIHFRGDGIDSVLMPIRTGIELERDAVEAVIAESLGPDALARDDDGDYQLKTDGVPVWARLLDGDPIALKVFATVAADIESSPDLFAELNDINASLRFARIDWSDNLVTVSSELVASTLDPEELFNAFARVKWIADDMSGVIVSRFGGRDLNTDAERWQAYLQTDVMAELSPEARDYLNGANAIPTVPFDGSAFVITAANPHNLIRSESDNDQANIELAIELAKVNGRFCACIAEARDGTHAERSFLVWNLPRETILHLAETFRQEAVFEITEDEFILVNVRNGEALSTPRRTV